jgi:anti-anti-sigma regulatory factor
MVQAPVARGWEFEVDRGPDWLFVRPRRQRPVSAEAPNLADHLWSLLEQHLTHRLVLELGDLDCLDDGVVEQLLALQQRLGAQDGVMRICELSAVDEDAISVCRLDSFFPRYRNREEAVMGRALPHQPR